MDVFEAIRTRRAVKSFDPGHVMTEDEIETLLSHAVLAPTSFNLQNWRFVVVRDPGIRKELREAAWGQAQVTDASLLVVLCGDLAAHAKQPARYWRDAPPAVQAALVPMIEPFYAGNERLARDEVMRSTGLAGQTLMLAAKAMGYDSCPMVGFDPVRFAAILRLPADHAVSFMIAIGKATKPAHPRGGALPRSEVVIQDRFPESAAG
jgi:nitroreductase